jgi:hypothetical protein
MEAWPSNCCTAFRFPAVLSSTRCPAVCREAEEHAAQEANARREAEDAAQEGLWAAEWAAGPQYATEEYSEEEDEEEGEYEYAEYYQGQQVEREASFGPGVALEIADSEPRAAAAVFKESDENSGERQIEPGPEEECSGAGEEESPFNVSSGLGRRENVNAHQCPRQKSYPRGRKWHVQPIRSGPHGSWRKLFDAYCGIVGGAAVVPGVDVFDAPVEVSCAGYGVFSAVELLIEG